jgi:hypothetical protein
MKVSPAVNVPGSRSADGKTAQFQHIDGNSLNCDVLVANEFGRLLLLF